MSSIRSLRSEITTSPQDISFHRAHGFFLPVMHCEAARQGVRDITRALPESQRNGHRSMVLAFTIIHVSYAILCGKTAFDSEAMRARGIIVLVKSN